MTHDQPVRRQANKTAKILYTIILTVSSTYVAEEGNHSLKFT